MEPWQLPENSGFAICCSGLPELRDPEVECYGALVDAQHQLVNVGDHVALLTGEDEASMDNDVFYAYACQGVYYIVDIPCSVM